MLNQLEEFLIAARSVRNTQGGTKETSYYTAIDNLHGAIGAVPKPKALTQAKHRRARNAATEARYEHRLGDCERVSLPGTDKLISGKSNGTMACPRWEVRRT